MSQPSHDTEVVPQMQLPPRLLDLWETEIVPQLPATLDEQARALKAYQRYREIKRASDLFVGDRGYGKRGNVLGINATERSSGPVICYERCSPGCWEDARFASWGVGR